MIWIKSACQRDRRLRSDCKRRFDCLSNNSCRWASSSKRLLCWWDLWSEFIPLAGQLISWWYSWCSWYWCCFFVEAGPVYVISTATHQLNMEGWSMCRKRRLVPSILTSCGRWPRIIRHIWRLVSWRSDVAMFWWFVLDDWVSPISSWYPSGTVSQVVQVPLLQALRYHYCKLWGNIITCLWYRLWLQKSTQECIYIYIYMFISDQNPYFHPIVSWEHLWTAHLKKKTPLQNSCQKKTRLCWCSTMESTTGTWALISCVVEGYYWKVIGCC